MKFFKLCAMLLAFGFMSGCQTTSDLYGSGELEFSEEMDATFKKYLAIFSMPGQTDSSNLFMVDPKTGNAAYGSGGRQISTAVNHIQEACGEGCKIFAVNRRIVWEGFPDIAKYEAERRAYEKYAKSSLRYYEKDAFNLTYIQKSKIHDFDPSDTYHTATAVSIDGETVGQYSQQHNRFHRRRDLERLAMVSCLAASGGEDCYIYSYDEVNYN